MDKIALTNVRVFDGERLGEPTTVVIDVDRIGGDQTGARTWDGGGGVLLPGLIDCHIHLTDDARISAFGFSTRDFSFSCHSRSSAGDRRQSARLRVRPKRDSPPNSPAIIERCKTPISRARVVRTASTSSAVSSRFIV